MAYTTTYNDLVADLQDITENNTPEFQAQIPKIIARAQDNVQRDLGLDIWRAMLTVNTTSLSREVARNPAWLEIRSIFVPSLGQQPLQRRTIDWVRMYGPSQGPPKYWTEMNETTIWLSPIPDTIYALQIETLERLPPLGPGTQTNWMTRHVGDLLLLAALIGAEMYLLSRERVAEFVTMYDRLMAAARQELRAQERTGYAPTRSAPIPTLEAGSHA